MGRSQIWQEAIGTLFHKPWCFLKTEESITTGQSVSLFCVGMATLTQKGQPVRAVNSQEQNM